jgi:hypothetical protein
MALHQKVAVAPGISIEFHAGSAGEQFIGQNAQGPAENPNALPAKSTGKQTIVTTPYQKIVTPA